MIFSLHDQKGDEGEDDRPDQANPAKFIGGFHIEAVPGVKVKMPEACKIVIPDAQQRKRPNQLTKPRGDEAVGDGKIALSNAATINAFPVIRVRIEVSELSCGR